ncbi:CoA protein activase [bacterium]|nr:CoA protein activase [bacterium]
MKATFPHMGRMDIFIKGIVKALGMEAVVPPTSSKKALNLGVKYAPEFVCLPFKLMLGNLIEAFERGADTVIMVSDRGPCRLGLYGLPMQIILKNLGYEANWLILNTPHALHGLFQLGIEKEVVKYRDKLTFVDGLLAFHFGWKKMLAIEEIERLSLKIRPYEINKGDTTKGLYQGMEAIESADNLYDLKKAKDAVIKDLRSIPQDRNRRPLKIAIAGEIFVVLDSFANLDIEKKLGELGCEVDRTIWFSTHILHHVGLDKFMRRSKGKAVRAARPYLKHPVGAECNATVGYAILYAEEGYDGFIHLMPFTCMPEFVAGAVLTRVSKDYNIPIFTVELEEHSSQTHLMTRLEAFVDLLKRKRQKRQGLEGSRGD